MPRDMLREMWLGLKRFWGLRWFVKGPILAGLAGLIVVVLVFALRAGGLSEAEKHYNRGLDLRDDERWEEAIAEYSKAINLDPNYAKAYNNRGSAYSYLGDLRHAIVDYDKAIALDPEKPQPYANRGLAYSALGDPDQAIADLQRALSLASDPGLKAQIEDDIARLRDQ